MPLLKKTCAYSEIFDGVSQFRPEVRLLLVYPLLS
jgi:hypothetical protein